MADGTPFDDTAPPVPQPVTRVFDFAAWQANHPLEPLPGIQVNSEVDRTNQTVNLIADRLALIQRDDGQLANDSIGTDQISDEALQEIVDEVAGETLTQADAAAQAAIAAAESAAVAQEAAEAAAAAAEAQVLPNLPAAPNSQVVTDPAGGSYILAATILPLDATAWDVGLHRLARVSAPVALGDAATKQYVDDSVTAAGGIPVPANAGDVLTATGAIAGAFAWEPPAITQADLDAVALPLPGVGDTGKFFKATGANVFGWIALAWPDISNLIMINIAAVATWLGLKSGAYTIVGTAATKNVGVAAGNVVQVDGAGKLPVIDGSQLTNLNSAVRTVVQNKVASYPMVLADIGTEIEFTHSGDLTLLSAAAAGNGAKITIANACPLAEVADYANPGGSGDRTAMITVTSNIVQDLGTWDNLVDGSTAVTSAGGVDLPIIAAAGKEIVFDFGVKKFVNQVTATMNVAQTALFNYEGSNDKAIWTPLTGNFAMPVTCVTDLVGGDPQGYRYYRLVGISGNLVSSWLTEFTFRIANNGYASDKVNLIGTVDGIVNRRMSVGDRTTLRSDGVVWKTDRGVYTFESAEQVCALSTMYTVPHGLGEKPTRARAVFRCKDVDLGWLVGDEIEYATVDWTYGSSVQADDVNVRAGINQTYFAYFNNKASAAGAAATIAKWRLVFYCESRKG